ncbi:MAG: glycosyltransferase family 4 protein [Aquabacterium sp.]|nr:glycosyltransferase family 4 protein [Aquabacterium sp.]
MPRELPAIKYEPDGYSLSGPSVVGRQAAGHAFLRAAVQACDGGTLAAYTPHEQSAQAFSAAVHAIDPNTKACWVPANHLDSLASIGALYIPDPGLAAAARARLRRGPAAYSMCGVTHTLSSHWSMDAIKQLVSAPVMPWDALICTSTSARQVVERVVAQEQDYLRWRLGVKAPLTLPQLPIIPLGVHTGDFAFTPADRQAARAALGIGADEVVMLFMGRLSFHSKAHPHAMYVGLQAAAAQTGRPITLLQCGRFGSDLTEAAFKEGAAQFCPDVRTLWLDGQAEAQRQQAWAGADVFISLSDNIQETFGLTPLEAMACGLPVVVSDWDGYKDTVRDGVDGFRIPTWMPAPGAGEGWATSLETGNMDFDMYSGLTCQGVAMDMQMLVERLVQLIEQPALRQRMGQEGRARATQDFDWRVVFVRYLSLWAELNILRRDAAVPKAPQAPHFDAARQDPYRLFAGYGTHEAGPLSQMQWRDASVTVNDVLATLRSPLFNYAVASTPAQLQRLTEALKRLKAQPCLIQDWARANQAPVGDMILLACQLAKAGAINLSLHPQP